MQRRLRIRTKRFFLQILQISIFVKSARAILTRLLHRKNPTTWYSRRNNNTRSLRFGPHNSDQFAKVQRRCRHHAEPAPAHGAPALPTLFVCSCVTSSNNEEESQLILPHSLQEKENEVKMKCSYGITLANRESECCTA